MTWSAEARGGQGDLALGPSAPSPNKLPESSLGLTYLLPTPGMEEVPPECEVSSTEAKTGRAEIESGGSLQGDRNGAPSQGVCKST